METQKDTRNFQAIYTPDDTEDVPKDPVVEMFDYVYEDDEVSYDEDEERVLYQATSNLCQGRTLGFVYTPENQYTRSFADTMVGGDTSACKNVEAAGFVTAGAGIIVTGSTQIGGQIIFVGTTIMAGDLHIGGTDIINGPIFGASGMSETGDISIIGNVTVGTSMTVIGSALMDGGLIVGSSLLVLGTATFNSPVTFVTTPVLTSLVVDRLQVLIVATLSTGATMTMQPLTAFNIREPTLTNGGEFLFNGTAHVGDLWVGTFTRKAGTPFYPTFYPFAATSVTGTVLTTDSVNTATLLNWRVPATSEVAVIRCTNLGTGGGNVLFPGFNLRHLWNQIDRTTTNVAITNDSTITVQSGIWYTRIQCLAYKIKKTVIRMWDPNAATAMTFISGSAAYGTNAQAENFNYQATVTLEGIWKNTIQQQFQIEQYATDNNAGADLSLGNPIAYTLAPADYYDTYAQIVLIKLSSFAV